MEVVGSLSPYVAGLLGIDLPDDPRIYLGESNEIHMKTDHPEEYRKYRYKIYEILDVPDYVRYDSTDGSIEYVKVYQVDGDFVKVAVRMSQRGQLFARSLYTIRGDRVNRYLEKGLLIRTNLT